MTESLALNPPSRVAPPRSASTSGYAASLAITWSRLFDAPPLSDLEAGALTAIAHTKHVTTGVDIFSHEAPARALLLLQAGSAALGFRTSDGEFHVERTVQAPAWLDQGSAWLGQNHAMDARASTLCTVVELPIAPLRELLLDHPGLAQRLICCLSREVQTMAAHTHELMHKDAPARLAAWMAQRCQPLPPDASSGVLQLQGRKRDLAAQLAITPETLSRLMRSFARQGVIAVAGYTVQVLDVAALRKLAA